MVGCSSEQPSPGSDRELSQVHPSPTTALHSEPWCLASQGRQSQTFSQDQCLPVPSPCKVLTNQDGFWVVAAALGVGLSQQSGTIAFHSFAEQEPLYVCLASALPDQAFLSAFLRNAVRTNLELPYLGGNSRDRNNCHSRSLILIPVPSTVVYVNFTN